jgi:pyruvate/2-oxoglutarate dehydrogenase complex dihydrolipoamide acyltransferase (E2) component
VDFEVQEEGFLAKQLTPKGTRDIPIGQVRLRLCSHLCLLLRSSKLVAILVEKKEDVPKFKDYSEAPPPTPTPTPAPPAPTARAATPTAQAPATPSGLPPALLFRILLVHTYRNAVLTSPSGGSCARQGGGATVARSAAPREHSQHRRLESHPLRPQRYSQCNITVVFFSPLPFRCSSLQAASLKEMCSRTWRASRPPLLSL